MARVYEHAHVNGTDIHFHFADYTDPWRDPPAETFLLYPGYCRNIEFWHAWVPLLGRSSRVLRMDPRGYGHSAKPPLGEGVDLDQSIADALGLMDHLGLERVHWVGESTGGKVGMAIALHAPHRIASITGCNTTGKTPRQTVDTYALGEADQAAAIEKYGVAEWCRRTLKYRVDESKIAPELGEWWAQEMGRVPVHVAVSAFRRFTTVDLWPRLAEIAAPTLLILGENCPEYRKQQLEEMTRILPRGKLARLEGYDFGIHYLAPERCVQAVREFVSEQTRKRV
jgi:pimeloyl-ACP methyl ester carboxylesterase